MVRWSDGDVVLVDPEVDLVPRLDPELVAHLLGNHDLPLRPDSVSHTAEYDSDGFRSIRSRQVVSDDARSSAFCTLPMAFRGSAPTTT